MVNQWFKNRFVDFKFGYTFIAYFTGAFNFSTLISIYLKIPIQNYVYFLLGIISVFVLVATYLGSHYRKIQNSTDVLITNKPLLDEIRVIVREEIQTRNS